MVSFEELLNADVADLPLRTRTNAFFAGTEHLADFVNQVMAPLLKGLLQPTDKELAVIGTYYRMMLMMRALVVLNNVQFFQTAASTARSLFELLVDIKLLAADKNGDMVSKYHGFAEIERYRSAEQLINFEDQNPGSISQSLSSHRSYLADPQRTARIVASKTKGKNGKLRYPTHWSSLSDLRSRAVSLNLEADYVQLYPLLSWYVHAGATGVAGLSADALESCFAISHSHSQRIFLDATVTCAKVTKLDIATEGQFKDWIEQLRLKPGIVLTESQIAAIKKGKLEKERK